MQELNIFGNPMTRDISRITLYEAHLISSIAFGKQGFQSKVRWTGDLTIVFPFFVFLLLI